MEDSESSVIDKFAAAIEKELFEGRLPRHADAPRVIAEIVVRFYVNDDREEVKEHIARKLESALSYRLSARLAAEGTEFKN
jgi:hypothetical protein